MRDIVRLMVSVPAAHKHGGKGATEARRVFGVELRTWKREESEVLTVNEFEKWSKK